MPFNESLNKVKNIVQSSGVKQKYRRCAKVANELFVSLENNPEVQENYVCNIEAVKMSTHHAFNVMRVDDRYYSVDINEDKILEGDDLKQLRENIVSTYTYNNDEEHIRRDYIEAKHILLADQPIAVANIREDDEVVNYKWHADGAHKCTNQTPSHQLFPTDFSSIVPQNIPSINGAALLGSNAGNLEHSLTTAIAVQQLFPVAFANSVPQNITTTLRGGAGNLEKLIPTPFTSRVQKNTILPDSIASSRLGSDDSFFTMP